MLNIIIYTFIASEEDDVVDVYCNSSAKKARHNVGTALLSESNVLSTNSKFLIFLIYYIQLVVEYINRIYYVLGRERTCSRRKRYHYRTT